MVDGTTRYIELERDKQSVIDVGMHNILRITKEVQFKRIEKLIRKI